MGYDLGGAISLRCSF